jgi:NhaP-type Na+/H+ or K+/H+ antiporter
LPEPSRREGGRGRRRATEFLNPLVTLGIVFLIGLGADLAARRLHLPRVTLLVLAGFAVGPGGFGLIPGLAADWLDWVVRLALSMVGFLVGSSLTREGLATAEAS